eukprot:2461222-Amphidinium_carterae.1
MELTVSNKFKQIQTKEHDTHATFAQVTDASSNGNTAPGSKVAIKTGLSDLLSANFGTLDSGTPKSNNDVVPTSISTTITSLLNKQQV